MCNARRKTTALDELINVEINHNYNSKAKTGDTKFVVVEAEKQDSVCFELYFNKQQKETTY